MRIGIVAAEPSGDQLASHLMQAIIERVPEVRFEGIGGPLMQGLGMQSWYPMEKLSVMGLVEVLRHLPELLGIRRELVRRWQASPPDLFIGVDAPDFNLGLSQRLKQSGIKTVQYVCPTIWAWREGRVKTIKKAIDLVLSIYPFEVPLLAGHNIHAAYAGNPLAQRLGQPLSNAVAREVLGLSLDQLGNQPLNQPLNQPRDEPSDQPVLGLLPGSRRAEVEQLGDVFLQAAALLAKQIPGLQVVIPAATPGLKSRIESQLQGLLAAKPEIADQLQVQVIDGQSKTVMAAADALLVASGTATLEAMLHRVPMVVGYRVHWLTYFITVKLGLLKTRFVSLPNILAGEALVSERLQSACTPDNLAADLAAVMQDQALADKQRDHFSRLNAQIAKGNPAHAADAVLALTNAGLGGV